MVMLLSSICDSGALDREYTRLPKHQVRGGRTRYRAAQQESPWGGDGLPHRSGFGPLQGSRARPGDESAAAACRGSWRYLVSWPHEACRETARGHAPMACPAEISMGHHGINLV